MSRYYFHVRNGGFPLDDETGEVHRTIEPPKRGLGFSLASFPTNRSYRGYSIVVIDEDGKTIASVPITPD
jgi:hypothetical protein